MKVSRTLKNFSWQRLWAIIAKEFIQMRRDRMTMYMLIGIPIIQLLVFGYAINNNPKKLPTAMISADHSNFTRAFLQAMENSDYFRFVKEAQSEQEAQRLLQTGKVQFVVNIPPHFTRDLVRGDRPSILLEVDATDPAANSYALAAVNQLVLTAFDSELTGTLASLQSPPPPVDMRIHAVYNPLIITQYNIVPGLLGVVLTMTMVIITTLTITREYERGTIENLLATPVQPLEVILGKIIPFIGIGYTQVAVILICAVVLFNVPISGSLALLLLLCFPFIVANLTVGLTFSTLAKNQLQSIQASLFFFLPSILLSGFMFPFHGMPQWAQWIGHCLPLSHFVNIVRGIMLKGNGFMEVWPSLWPILVFTLVMLFISLKRYRQTLD